MLLLQWYCRLDVVLRLEKNRVRVFIKAESCLNMCVSDISLGNTVFIS